MRHSTDRQPARPRRRAARGFHLASRGFTLTELLVSVVITAVLAGVTATLLSQDLGANRNLERFQRVRRQVNHARRFIELEASSATRLTPGNNSLQFFGVHDDGSPWTITYDLVAAGSASVSGVTFRGPFVLRRNGPPYTTEGNLDDNAANQNTVILDGLENAQAFTVTSPAGSSRGAQVGLDLEEDGATYNANFSLAIVNDPRFGLLQNPTSSFTGNCSGSPAGCRNDGTTQEWDTRLISGTTITPVGSPAQVIVYFNAPKPKASNDAIRGTKNDALSRCTRTQCYVEVDSASAYTINGPVNQLVFTDEVVAVPPN